MFDSILTSQIEFDEIDLYLGGDHDSSPNTTSRRIEAIRLLPVELFERFVPKNQFERLCCLQSKSMSKPEVLIVGGGIAGLCCARRLNQAGVSNLVLESAGSVGGRARTDEFRGFRLDRGFQVLLTEYSEAKEVLDYEILQLKCFEPGALVRYKGKFRRFADPWRRPRHLFQTAFSPIASFADKLRVARLRSRVCRGSIDELNNRPETTTMERLRAEGFSNHVIEHFFKPFLGGVFLESELSTSSRKFDFVFRMFSSGDAAMPATGMGAISDQLAAGLPHGSVQTNTKVIKVGPQHVVLGDGRKLSASNVVIACEAPVAARLVGEEPTETAHGVTCIYFSADAPPLSEPILVLNGEGHGPINNLCVPSQLVPGCAPVGKSLISITVLGAMNRQELKLLDEVRTQLREWFGAAVNTWEHLKTFHIPYALPNQNPPAQMSAPKSAINNNGIIMCGDYLDNASIQGAMVSGRRAAEFVLDI